MSNKIELLSPAGNMSSLKAAIAAGCDAVYLSGNRFGARAFANNFTNDEIIEAIKLCHLYGVKVYVTVNTLVYEREVKLFMDYIDFLHQSSVDAIIIQDIGMMDLVRKTYPNLEIHASTQMHIHNLEGAKLLEELGIKRTVLARETPISLVKKIRETTNIELEIFGHGALCISYSGQCLMSSLIGGRSGNRGTCAQSCRKPYDLIYNDQKINKDNYLLSTRDLCTLHNLDELIESGCASLKIEGRMKRPEYVYLVTHIYRKAIDSYYETGKVNIDNNDIRELKKIFNREFTKGFLFDDDNDNIVNSYRPNHMGVDIGKVIDYKNGYAYIRLTDQLHNQDGIRFVDNDIGLTVTNLNIKNDVALVKIKDRIKIGCRVLKTTDYEQLNRINKLIDNGKRVTIDMTVIVNLNKPIILIFDDGLNKVSIASEYIVQESKNSPTTKDSVIKQLSKLGNTIYQIGNIDVCIDDNVFIPVGVLNNLRREAIEILNKKRLYKTNYKRANYDIELPDYPYLKKTSILVHDITDDILNYDEVYTEVESDYTLKLPRVLESLPSLDKRVLVGDLGSVYKYKNKVTDFSLNVVNSYSVALLHSLGVDKVTLSYELNDIQIKELIDAYHDRYHKHPNLELIIEGYEEVMISKYKMIDNSYLKDSFGNKYKIKLKDNLMYIYNYKYRKMQGNYYDMGINYLRINREVNYE